MPITHEELKQLQNAKSRLEWGTVCDAIKSTRGGEYPSDWFQKVMQSGILSAAERLP